jgi:Zn-dependent protease
VYVHWTFLVLVGIVLLSNLKGGLGFALYSVALLAAVFGCVVLHEFGHALTARRFGIPTLDITLYPIGGVARLGRLIESAWGEFWIAIAGPAVNVVIAGILSVLLYFSREGSALTPTSVDSFLHGNFIFDLLVINIGLVVFNMLPAFPMDGGRVLRSILVPQLGRLRATEVAAGIGTAFSILFVIWGLFGNPMLLLVGMFAYLAGRQELAAVRQSEFRRLAEPIDVLPVGDEILDVLPVPSESGFSGFTWDERAHAWIAWRNGRPTHMYRAD